MYSNGVICDKTPKCYHLFGEKANKKQSKLSSINLKTTGPPGSAIRGRSIELVILFCLCFFPTDFFSLIRRSSMCHLFRSFNVPRSTISVRSTFPFRFDLTYANSIQSAYLNSSSFRFVSLVCARINMNEVKL